MCVYFLNEFVYGDVKVFFFVFVEVLMFWEELLKRMRIILKLCWMIFLKRGLRGDECGEFIDIVVV